jgi:hypothetical protein
MRITVAESPDHQYHLRLTIGEHVFDLPAGTCTWLGMTLADRARYQAAMGEGDPRHVAEAEREAPVELVAESAA